jgi:two-component system phosphate regulon sensor histidine kinase PhoR
MGDGDRGAVRESRSIIFYAWAGLAVQSVLAAGVITFALAGAAYQRSAITDLSGRVQAAQVANLTMLADILDAQRAARGYQATGEAGLLQAYHAGQHRFGAALSQVRRLAPAGVSSAVIAEARSAQSAFLADNQAVTASAGTPAAARLYARASASADAFTGQSDQLQMRLAQDGDVLTARSERTVSAGLDWISAILAAWLMLPVIAVTVGLRRISRHLHAATTAARRRAHGDTAAQAVPGGTADVRELALSINFLADEGDRARATEGERTRLHAKVRQASIQIREHLHGEAIIREAVTAIREHLSVDFVAVGMVSGERLTPADGDPDAWGQVADIVGYFPPDSVGWMRNVYRHRSSYRVQDLHAQAEEIPAEIRTFLLSHGAAALLLTPFGAGQELLGCLTLLRNDPGSPWTQAEIEAVESLAGDIGRGLEHARLYEGEERLVAELKSLDRAKATFLASASHDLRTPLTSIISYVDLLSDSETGLVQPAQVKMLEVVDRNTRRLQTAIEDMLTISKIELGAFTSQLHPLDLTSLVPAAADVIRPSAAARGLELTMSCPDQDLMVEGDPEQLDRMLVNLLSNAVKYTPSGGSIALSVVQQGDSAVLTVADSGIGIPAKDQNSLFTRFFRASNAIELAIPGSGLGLSIVQTIVANHHADLSVESAQDRGTKVTVRIPLQCTQAAEPNGDDPER